MIQDILHSYSNSDKKISITIRSKTLWLRIIESLWEHLMLYLVPTTKSHVFWIVEANATNLNQDQIDDDKVKLCNEKKYVLQRMDKSALELLIFLAFSLTVSL